MHGLHTAQANSGRNSSRFFAALVCKVGLAIVTGGLRNRLFTRWLARGTALAQSLAATKKTDHKRMRAEARAQKSSSPPLPPLPLPPPLSVLPPPPPTTPGWPVF